VVSVDTVQDPPRGGHRGHRPVQILTITEHRDPADRVRAISDGDREIGEDASRGMKPRTRYVSANPGVRHHASAVRADLDPRDPLATLHL